LPRHYYVDLTPEEVELIDQHWLKWLNPEKLKNEEKWTEPKDGEDRNRIGLLTECAVNKWAHGTPVETTLANRPEVKEQHWTGDEGFDITICGFKLDVKCQHSKYQPNTKWLWNVPDEVARDPNKECEGYLWVYKKTGNDYNYRLIGWMPRGEFIEKALFHTKGEKKPYQNGFYTMDTLDIRWPFMHGVGDFKRSML
jgi:hypothetical protein